MFKYLKNINVEEIKIPSKDRNYEAKQVKEGLYFFKDSKENLHFGIKVDSQEKISDPKVNGISVEIGRFNKDGSSEEFIIDLRLNINRYEQQFLYLCDEIIGYLVELKYDRVKAVNYAVNRNKIFWEKKRKSLLSIDKQVGLICELDFLNKIININKNYMISSWTGPFKAKYDFTFSENYFEIKGTLRNKHSHFINGMDQLEFGSEKNLYLVSYLITKSIEKNSKSIKNYVRNILNLLNDNYEAFVMFNSCLYEYGYNPLDEDDYECFDFHEILVYEVNDNFPKLIPSMLVNSLSERISKVNYKVDLDGLKSMKIDQLKLGNYCF